MSAFIESAVYQIIRFISIKLDIILIILLIIACLNDHYFVKKPILINDEELIFTRHDDAVLYIRIR